MVAIDWRKSWSNLPSDGCGRLGFQDAQVGSMASHRRQPWQVYYRPQQPFIAAGAAAYLSGRLVEKGTGSAGQSLVLGIGGAARVFRGSGCYRSPAAASRLFHGGNVGQSQRVEEKSRSSAEDLAS